MTENVEEEVEKKFPKAAPGSGAILYLRGPKPNSLLVGCASRAKDVGVGYGISFGGFGEVIEVLKLPIGGVILMEEEAWREATEEIPGIEAYLTFEDFMERRVYLTSFMVHTPDSNKAHCPTFFACPVSAAEQKNISALPPGIETTGPLEFFVLEWEEGNPTEITLNLPIPLNHGHEVRAFKALAALADAGKLEYLD